MRRWAVIALFVGIVSATFAQNAPDDFFPTSLGTEWTYSGTVSWTKPNSNDVVHQRVTTRMTIVDHFIKNGYDVTVVEGGPWELAWYDPSVKPQKHAIIRKDFSYYILDATDVLLSSLKNGEWEADKAEPWFKIPMKDGDLFCSPDQPKREDTFYCWHVEAVDRAPIASLDISRPVTQYKLRFQTMPDHEIDILVKGIGITHYTYMHHGTVAEADVRLIRFKLGRTAR